MNKPKISRRNILGSTLGLGVLGFSPGIRAAMTLTPGQTEGPFYPRDSHRFADRDNDLVKIESAVKQAGGQILHLSGRVLESSGKPVRGARVEIWQCDVTGRYLHPRDGGSTANRDPYFQGFGHAVADTNGAYHFRTIRPVPYTGRTPHIHFKVLSDNGKELLTTQMYLAGEPLNQHDFLYRRIAESQRDAVTVALQSSADHSYTGTFDLVVGG